MSELIYCCFVKASILYIKSCHNSIYYVYGEAGNVATITPFFEHKTRFAGSIEVEGSQKKIVRD